VQELAGQPKGRARLARAVERIAQHWAALVGKVNPDLVRAAGLQSCFEQRVFAQFTEVDARLDELGIVLQHELHVIDALLAAIADPEVTVEFQAPPEKAGVQPPLSREVMAPIEALSRDMYPGIAVIPTINSGATDGRFLTPVGIPTYGVSGMLSDGATSNAHGLNERIRVQTLIEGREFLYRLTKAYAGGK